MFKTKTVGNDGISSRLVKLAKPSIVSPFTWIGMSPSPHQFFPDSLKVAQVVPIHEERKYFKKKVTIAQ